MFDPVWFGNDIVPRWEALAIAGGTVVGITILAFVAVLATCLLVLNVGKRLWKWL